MPTEGLTRVLRTCWESYVSDGVRGAAPAVVVKIGRQVDAAIGEIVRRDLGENVRVEVIKQPNSHMSSALRL
jgi:hypothetical protein